MELEQERLARLQDAEVSEPTGLPEVDLVGLQPNQFVEPVAVGDADPDLRMVVIDTAPGDEGSCLEVLSGDS